MVTILAEQSPPLVIAIAVAFVIVLGVFALGLFRAYEFLARRSLERRYADLKIHADPQAGDVILSYVTYHGFIAWFSQTPHHVALPPDDARKLLGRLLRFNLTWGLVTYGCLFILPLALLNYITQRRSIGKQQAAGGIKLEASNTTTAMEHEVSQSPSSTA